MSDCEGLHDWVLESDDENEWAICCICGIKSYFVVKSGELS